MCEKTEARKVVYYKWKKKEGCQHYEKVPGGDGIFHQWGIDYQEFENGAGNFSTAIIELPDGTVKNVQADMIQFIKE